MSDALRGSEDLVREYASLVEQVSAAASGRRPRGGKRATPKVDTAITRRAIRDLIDAYVQLPFRVVVPGTHDGGISNDALMAILAAGGRDFAAPSPQLKAYVKARLQQDHGNADAVPLRLELDVTRQKAVADFVRGRMQRKVRDVPIRALKPSTIERKRREGYSNPALPGYATGELYEALAKLRVIDAR